MADSGLLERRRARDRERMVREHVEARGVRDPRVLQALRDVPRHRFVRSHLESKAYGDHALPIEGGQTISQPWVVARMSELLAVEAHQKVLEVGTGSGYQTAVLARLARWVWSLERVPELAHLAIARLRELGIENAKVQIFDGSMGWAESAPFDRILVTAAAPEAPAPLLEQLGPRGRLVVPVGDRSSQRLVVYEKAASRVLRREHDAVAFVPLLGRHAWEGAS